MCRKWKGPLLPEGRRVCLLLVAPQGYAFSASASFSRASLGRLARAAAICARGSASGAAPSPSTGGRAAI